MAKDKNQNGEISAVAEPTKVIQPADAAPKVEAAKPLEAVKTPRRRKPVEVTPPKPEDPPTTEYAEAYPEETAQETTEEPAPKVEPTPDKPVKTPEVKAEFAEPVVFTPELMGRAQVHGLTQSDLQDIGDAKAVEKVLDKLDRNFAQQVRTQQAAKPEAPTKATFDRAGMLEKWAPEVVDLFEAEFNRHQASEERNNQLQSRLDRIEQDNTNRQLETRRQAIDGWFNDLGADFAPVFGEGEGRRLGRESAEMKARLDVLQEMDALAVGYKAQNRQISEADLFQRAVRMTQDIPQKQKTPERERDASGQFIARAAPRDTSVAGVADDDADRDTLL